MAINTLTDLNDLITNGTAAERRAFKNIIVNGLNAQDLADIITSSTRERKEALAALIVQAQRFLRQTDTANEQTASDNRRATALSYITNTIEPLLPTPTGDYVTQHAQFMANIKAIEGQMPSGIDPETDDELRKRKEQEKASLDALRQQHAQGLIS